MTERRRAPALLVAVALLAAGCAPARLTAPAGQPSGKPHPHSAHGEMPAWRLADLAEGTQPTTVLRAPTGLALTVETARVKLMYATAQKVLAAAGPGEAPDWLLVGTPVINAYAAYQSGRPVIAVTLGMVHLLGDDGDAWSALFGHELAHFRLGHHEAYRTRKQATDIGSSIVGLALSAAGLGFGSVVADATGTLVERSFSRDDERDADRTGFDYLRRAGYDGRGALRLQQGLLDATRESSLGFLSTHPGGRERLENLQRLIDETAPKR